MYSSGTYPITIRSSIRLFEIELWKGWICIFTLYFMCGVELFSGSSFVAACFIGSWFLLGSGWYFDGDGDGDCDGCEISVERGGGG